MPIFIYDMGQIERVMDTDRDDLGVMHNHLRRLEQIQLNKKGQVNIPQNTAAILLPTSEICLFYYRVERTGIEWVTRQFDQLKNYDLARLVHDKPVFFPFGENGEMPPEVERFIVKKLR